MKLRTEFLALTLAFMTAFAAPASLVARAQAGQTDGAAPAAVKGYPAMPPEAGHAFIVTEVDGKLVCRDASPAERRQILERDPSVSTSPARPVLGAFQTYDAQSGKTSAEAATDPTTGAAAGHLDIVLRPTAQLQANPQAMAAFERAAANWENVITTDITVVIDVDFGTTRFGTAYPEHVIGSTSGGIFYAPPYTDVRGRLNSRATPGAESSLMSVLPTGPVPTDSGSLAEMDVSSPQARALGAIAAHANPTATTGNDVLGRAPSIGFNSAFNFDFDPTNGIASGLTDFDAVVTHEIGHVLGFDSEVGLKEVDPDWTLRPTIWDLFRFRPGTTLATFQTAQRVLTTGGEQRYFDGAPELALSTGNPEGVGGDEEQASHWKDDRFTGLYIGIMDPTIASGVRRLLTANDRRAVDYLGYNLGAPPPAPANDNFVNAVTLQGATGSVLGNNLNASREAGEPVAVLNLTVGGSSVWYSWAAPATGTATFDTVGSDFDTTLAVFTGASVGALTRVKDNDDITQAQNVASRVTFNVTAGTVYRIMVDGFDGGSGNITLNWSSGEPPAPVSYSISGRVQDAAGNGLQGVRVALDGPPLINTFPHLPVTTDAAGNFQFSLLTPGGNYTVRSDDSRYTFSPPSASFSNISANQTGVTFTATPVLVPVTGRVVEGSQSLQGVFVGLYSVNDVLLQQTTTGADGRWTFASVPVGGSFNLRFAKSGYTFAQSPLPIVVGLTGYDAGVVAATKANPIEASDLFVTQHYRDFLGREPDQQGLNFWVNEIEQCGADAQCRELKRINVSAAFFLAIEFQETGYLVERMYKVAYGDTVEPSTGLVVPVIRREEFMQDTPLISNGVVVGVGNWQTVLEANKSSYAQAFVQRARFTNLFPAGMGADAFVDKLFQNAKVAPTAAERAAAVAAYGAGDAAGRAAALRAVAQSASVDAAEKNRAFVLMQYYGYLRRNPNDAPEAGLNFAGWNFWLGKLNEFGGNFVRAQMVKAFLDSIEYRQRFAAP